MDELQKTPLHERLCKVLADPFSDGDTHCYFEPPADIQIKYPCIVYHRSNDFTEFADNNRYLNYNRYTITIIDENPDSEIPERLASSFPYCTSDRNFSTDGLSHYIYTLFFKGKRI